MKGVRYGFPALLILLLATGSLWADEANNPAHIAQLRSELSQQELWPGYDPSTIPQAIYLDGTTWLYNFPGMPEGFVPADKPDTFTMAGQHPTIVANSSGVIDSVMVSTLLIDGGKSHTDEEWAAISLHEGFHVFQQQVTGWSTNEADLFLYPLESAEVLANRRLETWALAQALSAEGIDRVRWAATALQLRSERHEMMPVQGGRYESAVELVEGSAYYVESRARTRAGQPIPSDELLNPEGYELANIRARGYHTGIAFALLLDEFLPGWKDRISQPFEEYEVDWTPLHVLLATSVAIQKVEPMPLEEGRMVGLVQKANEEASLYQATQKQVREQYRQMDGWGIELVADKSKPLFLRGFDPMNVFRLGEGEVLNKRYIALGNDQAELQVMNQQALTISEGSIPLFTGVQTVIIAGLEEEPVAEDIEGMTRFTFEGGKLVVKNADFSKVGKKLTIHLHE